MLVPPELQPQKAPRPAKRSTCAVTGLPARYSSFAKQEKRKPDPRCCGGISDDFLCVNCFLCLLSTAVLDPVPTHAVHSSMLAQTNRSHGTLGWRPLLTFQGLLDNCQVSGCRATPLRSLNQLLPDQAACCLSSSGLADSTPQPCSHF